MEKHANENQSDSVERISNVFRGNENAQKELDICSDIIKIFIASTGKDFAQERQRLFNVVLPELQYQFRPQGLEIQLVDCQGSSQPEIPSIHNSLLHAHLLTDQLTEIYECHRLSPRCFMLCLIGNKCGGQLLPRTLEQNVYERLQQLAEKTNLDSSCLNELYQQDSNVIPPVQRLKWGTVTPTTEDIENYQSMQTQIQKWTDAFYSLYDLLLQNNGCDVDKTVKPLKSMVEEQLEYALQLSTNTSQNMICAIRDIKEINPENANAKLYLDMAVEKDGESSAVNQPLVDLQKTFQESIKTKFKESSNNLLQFSVMWQEKGIDPEVAECNNYLQNFCQDVLNKLKEMINGKLCAKPAISNLSKPVQDLFAECIGHLALNRDILESASNSATDDLTGSDFHHRHLRTIQELMQSHSSSSDMHGPIFIKGGDGWGKSFLLTSVFSTCHKCFSSGQPVVRIVRHCGQTPAGTYTPMLVQSLFCQITLACNLTTNQIHPNMEFPELCFHLQTAIEMVSKIDFQLVIILDDVQELKHPKFEEVVISGLLPWNLPPNVHFLCSIHSKCPTPEDSMKKFWDTLASHPMVKNQVIDIDASAVTKDPQSAVNLFLDNHARTLQDSQKQWLMRTLAQCPGTPLFNELLKREVLSWTSATLLPAELSGNGGLEAEWTSHEAILKHIFQNLENRFGKHAVSQVAQHLTCSLYGLAETELLELLSFTDDVFPVFEVGEPCYRCGVNLVLAWSNIKNAMKFLLKETRVANRLLLSWRHKCIASVARQLYLSDKVATATHSDIANLFLLEFLTEKENSSSSRVDLTSSSSSVKMEPRFTHPADSNPSLSDGNKISYSFRQIDQLWYHLLEARNIKRIKKVTACNFEFLYAALCTVSVGYALCILELVRSKILDFEIELIYHAVKTSMDILCKNPLQFAPVIISLLRPYSEVPLDAIEAMVTQAMEWCDTTEEPILVPMNTWVWNPVPESVSTLSCPRGVTSFVLSHDNQAVISSDREKAIHMHCLPSRKLLKTFTGHYGKVACLHVSNSGKYLISGSEDTTTIVWDIQTCGIRHRISEHIATVTCVATTLNDSLIISGSEDSRVLIAEMETGKVVYKLEHHRGMISCLAVANDVDILITGAADSAVCVWSLENFTLLNTLSFPFPVINMEVSVDRTFLLIACEDNKLYLRSLTTGSEIHTLDGHNSQVISMCIANDNCRALVGCADHQVYMYDLHTTKLLKVFSGHDGPITGIKVTSDDGFLFTSGGDSLKVWYFSPNKSGPSHGKAVVKKPQEQHTDKVLCVDISKDGTLGISGSADCTIKVWQLGTSDLHSTLEGHTGPVTCIACAPSCLFAVSGSEDKTLRVWGLTLGHIVSAFKEHDAPITSVKVASDSRKVLSADRSGYLKLWLADNGTVVLSCRGPTGFVDITTNMKFAFCGNKDNCIHIWMLSNDNRKHTVSHKETILCQALTFDSRHLITGSGDKSLKVWEVTTGRLTQVLVGHTAAVTCVSLAPLNHVLVLSGSEDCNLIAWDMQTGHEIHTMRCHTKAVTCAQLTVDGNIAVSGSNDETICIWDSQSGQLVTIFNLHHPIYNMAMSFDASHIFVHLQHCQKTPILCFHNCPPIDIQALRRLEKAMEKESSLQSALPRKVHRRILQKEMSLDSYTWAKKYGNFPGKRSFSNSLEDFSLVALSPISSSTQNLHNLAAQSKTNLQQSGFLDELQAVWDGTDPTENQVYTPTQTSAPLSAGLYGGRSVSSVSSLPATELIHQSDQSGIRNGSSELPDLIANGHKNHLTLEGSDSAFSESGVCVIL